MEDAVRELKNALPERGFPHADIKLAVENAGALQGESFTYDRRGNA